MDLLSGGGAVKMEDKSSIGGCLPPWESGRKSEGGCVVGQ